MTAEDLEAELEMDEEAVLERVRAADVAAGGRRCRICGCTDNAGCDPPCYWIEWDLCSTHRSQRLPAPAPASV